MVDTIGPLREQVEYLPREDASLLCNHHVLSLNHMVVTGVRYIGSAIGRPPRGRSIPGECLAQVFSSRPSVSAHHTVGPYFKLDKSIESMRNVS
jgi:hypothetical protein